MSAFAIFIPAFGPTAHAWHRARRALVSSLVTSCLLIAGRTIPAAEPVPESPGVPSIDWQTSPLDLDLRGMNGERYVFRCPPGKPQPSRVTGSGPYTDNSSICSTAVHAGALRAKDGGLVTIEIRPGQAAYSGSEQNYIVSGSYDHAWSGSFVMIKPDADASHPRTS